MARQKKDYITLNAKIDANIMARFSRYCDEVGQTKTTAIERILDAFLNAYDKGTHPAGTIKTKVSLNNEH